MGRPAGAERERSAMHGESAMLMPIVDSCFPWEPLRARVPGQGHTASEGRSRMCAHPGLRVPVGLPLPLNKYQDSWW